MEENTKTMVCVGTFPNVSFFLRKSQFIHFNYSTVETYFCLCNESVRNILNFPFCVETAGVYRAHSGLL